MGIEQPKVPRLKLKLKKIVRAHPNVHPRPRIHEAVCRNACVFECLPRDLKQEPLLWVDALRLAWRNTEHTGSKVSNCLTKPP